VCGIRGERYRREREGRETSRDRGKRGAIGTEEKALFVYKL